MTLETGDLEPYSAGAESKQADLCCTVDYDQESLTLLPQEIIDKDYGCCNPSRYVKKGDVVLDLGSGSGKICYMAAQLVGDKGNRGVAIFAKDFSGHPAGKNQQKSRDR